MDAFMVWSERIWQSGDFVHIGVSGPYLGFFVCGGKLGFREISDQYSYKKQPSKIRHYVRKKTFSFPGGGNCPLRPPAMYGPAFIFRSFRNSSVIVSISISVFTEVLVVSFGLELVDIFNHCWFEKNVIEMMLWFPEKQRYFDFLK